MIASYLYRITLGIVADFRYYIVRAVVLGD